MYAKKNSSKKIAAMVLAAVLLIGVGVGGTLAWLMDTTSTVSNTFTVGKIEITLDEARVNQDGNFLNASGERVGTLAEAERVTSNQYQAIPGKTYSKDPTLTVKKGNEKCYLFVKFEEIGNPGTYYTYDCILDDKDTNDNAIWTQGTGDNGDGVPTDVWYIIVEETAANAENDTIFYLLKDNKIQVKDTVTADNMEQATEAKLQWTAYAVQYMNDSTGFTPAQAWDIAQDGTLTTNS